MRFSTVREMDFRSPDDGGGLPGGEHEVDDAQTAGVQGTVSLDGSLARASRGVGHAEHPAPVQELLGAQRLIDGSVNPGGPATVGITS